jgi:uroporphyrinogen-III synthase
VAIGPKTAEALAEMGLKVDVMPKTYLLEDALNALAQHWSDKSFVEA